VSAVALNLPSDVPENVTRFLADFLQSAQRAFGEDLSSVVLFGSAAEGKLRKSSDVNLMLVLRRYDPASAEKVRTQLATAEAAILLRVMFLCQDELPAASEAFAQKFSDVLRRHVVLLGPDPFAGVSISRVAQVRRLRQVLLNLLLRLRDMHARHESGSPVVLRMLADSTGAVRTSAASLLLLQGHEVLQPKQALKQVADELAPSKFAAMLDKLSLLQESGTLPEADAESGMVALMELVAAMYKRSSQLSESQLTK